MAVKERRANTIIVVMSPERKLIKVTDPKSVNKLLCYG